MPIGQGLSSYLSPHVPALCFLVTVTFQLGDFSCLFKPVISLWGGGGAFFYVLDLGAEAVAALKHELKFL